MLRLMLILLFTLSLVSFVMSGCSDGIITNWDTDGDSADGDSIITDGDDLQVDGDGKVTVPDGDAHEAKTTDGDANVPDGDAKLPDGDDNVETENSSLVINEIAAKATNDSDETLPDWIEILNTGDWLDISGYVLKDDNNENIMEFSAGTSIAGGEYLVIEKDESGETGFTFGLGNSDSVRLFDNTGDLIDTTSWGDGASPENASWGRIPNGQGDFKTLYTPTKGEENIDNSPVDGDGPPVDGDEPGDEPVSCDDVPQGTPCCGDDLCDGPETAQNCPEDCAVADGDTPPVDGDEPGDEPVSCDDVPQGMPCCGDDLCDGPETAQNCPADCAVADGDEPVGPTSCTSDGDCLQAGACPEDAALGCTCETTPEGDFCIPSCNSNADCPELPNLTLTCSPEGVCIPEGGPQQ